MSFRVSDFYHNDTFDRATMRRIRKGAATAIVDRATGELIAGYSYNTCLFAVFADDSQVCGKRLYVNLTRFSVTTEGKHRWWLRRQLGPLFQAGPGQYDDDHYAATGEHRWVDGTPATGGIAADAFADYGVDAEGLRRKCLRQPTVDSCVRQHRENVDRFNARIDREVAQFCSVVQIGDYQAVRVDIDGQMSLSDAAQLAAIKAADLK